jgi:type IV pilus assembly protein PilY1
MQKNHLPRFALPTAGAVLLFSAALHAQLSIPNLPLTTQTNAKPMTMIVASKDHRLFYEAYNDTSDIDGDGVLDIRFKPNIIYFGLFDSNLCYTYSGSGPSGLFTPANKATNGKCPGQWSGNWLNYVTTSRIDALRKVLYGGHRKVDTADQTILRRAYIPQDAHSWAKKYTSANVDGYRISDYTPLGEPGPGRRHFFGNLTANANVNCATLNNCSDLPPYFLWLRTAQNGFGNGHPRKGLYWMNHTAEHELTTRFVSKYVLHLFMTTASNIPMENGNPWEYCMTMAKTMPCYLA